MLRCVWSLCVTPLAEFSSRDVDVKPPVGSWLGQEDRWGGRREPNRKLSGQFLHASVLAARHAGDYVRSRSISPCTRSHARTQPSRLHVSRRICLLFHVRNQSHPRRNKRQRGHRLDPKAFHQHHPPLLSAFILRLLLPLSLLLLLNRSLSVIAENVMSLFHLLVFFKLQIKSRDKNAKSVTWWILKSIINIKLV